MKRKKLIIALLAGVAVAGAAAYFFGTDSGKKEWKRLKKTGSVTADTFGTLKKEVTRNLTQARKQERMNALKGYVREAMAV